MACADGMHERIPIVYVLRLSPGSALRVSRLVLHVKGELQHLPC